MTADEVVFAGGKVDTNSTKSYYYLAKDGSSSITEDRTWFTMSPAYWIRADRYTAYVFIVQGSGSYPGNLNRGRAKYSEIMRPVVSLKSNVLVTGGDGSANSPYEVSL